MLEMETLFVLISECFVISLCYVPRSFLKWAKPRKFLRKTSQSWD